MAFKTGFTAFRMLFSSVALGSRIIGRTGHYEAMSELLTEGGWTGKLQVAESEDP